MYIIKQTWLSTQVQLGYLLKPSWTGIYVICSFCNYTLKATILKSLL
ncbi:hypothetical protein HMPREF1982_03443 [Clostridiales bacterium oral taxon 876 str. F0540]|nr:hypothetical protein HMPREF1982_03443 [Clostridiales bacterium oral taxon 876 str. F0540]